MIATPGREAAIAWLKRSFQLGVVSSLPCDEKGKVILALAGPMMRRELPAIKFATIYLTGLDDGRDAEELAMRVLNEWHGLEAGTGFEDISPADMKPDDPEPGPAGDEDGSDEETPEPPEPTAAGSMHIERVEPVKVYSKRFYMPFDIHTTCPKCGRDVTRDSSQSVSSPTPGAAMAVHFYCGFEPEDIEPSDPRWDELACYHEWSVDMVMDITLREATK